MLGVQINGTLNSNIAENVAVGKVFCNNAGSWLLLLGDVVAVTLSVGREVASIIIGGTGGAGDLHLCGTELSVVEKKGSLGCGLLLESYGSSLGGISRSDLEGGDLSTAEVLVTIRR